MFGRVRTVAFSIVFHTTRTYTPHSILQDRPRIHCIRILIRIWSCIIVHYKDYVAIQQLFAGVWNGVISSYLFLIFFSFHSLPRVLLWYVVYLCRSFFVAYTQSTVSSFVSHRHLTIVSYSFSFLFFYTNPSFPSPFFNNHCWRQSDVGIWFIFIIPTWI